LVLQLIHSDVKIGPARVHGIGYKWCAGGSKMVCQVVRLERWSKVCQRVEDGLPSGISPSRKKKRGILQWCRPSSFQHRRKKRCI